MLDATTVILVRPTAVADFTIIIIIISIFGWYDENVIVVILLTLGVKTDPWVMIFDITSASLKLSYFVYAF